MCKFKIDKITYSESQSRETYDVSKNKPLLYPQCQIFDLLFFKKATFHPEMKYFIQEILPQLHQDIRPERYEKCLSFVKKKLQVYKEMAAVF